MLKVHSFAVTVLAGLAFTLIPAWSQTPTQSTQPGQRTPITTPQTQGSDQMLSGTLVDADCKATNPSDKCEVSDVTKTFGLQTTAGKFIKLDAAGNEKVRTAIESAKQKTGAIPVSVRGQMEGETLKVDSVQIR